MRVKFIISLFPLFFISSFCVTASSAIFSPYKDTSINFNWNTNVISTEVNGQSSPVPLLGDNITPPQLRPGNNVVTIAFATGGCENESWGGTPGNVLASVNIPLFEAKKINYIISTGGAAGTFQCNSAQDMDTFLSRYQSSQFIGLDFDIEGGYDQDDLNALMSATAGAIQNNPNFKNLRVSITIATLAIPGSTINLLGQWALAAAKQYLGTNFNVNLMVMDYGGSGCQKNSSGQCDMAASALFAAQEFSKDYQIPLNRIELTPMIGENDTADEITTLKDIKTITQFVVSNNLAGLHYWSFDRDRPCNGLGASPTCNTISAAPLQFDDTVLSSLNERI